MEQYNKSPHHVEYVSTGEDELNFTQDDRQNAGYAGDSEFFTAELYTDQSSDTRGYSFNASPEQNGSNIHSHEYVLSDQFENLNTLIFLNAANLLGVRTRTCISCTNNEIKGVMNVLNNLINIEENYRFDETLFRPLDPEDQTTL
ncbi:hypothetical protein AAEX28_00950 [Lentisphaerota bacterium WC36G]|nr:hypothetical protein LJT99_03830 [Lentisphaerae bacterium WC36]